MDEIALKEAIRSLSNREKRILNLRFFKGMTQVEVSNEIGISQAQVSRLEKGALDRIKKNRYKRQPVCSFIRKPVAFYIGGSAGGRDRRTFPRTEDRPTSREQLKEGAIQLRDGMKASREEGIGKIVDTFGGERGKPSHRIQAVTDPSRQYTFAGGPRRGGRQR